MLVAAVPVAVAPAAVMVVAAVVLEVAVVVLREVMAALGKREMVVQNAGEQGTVEGEAATLAVEEMAMLQAEGMARERG